MARERNRSSGRRPYHSLKRRQQADATRRRLVDSARTLFGRQGYGPTTIDAIAAHAGVAVQTFYATFGSKRAVLLALLDRLETDADVGTLASALRSNEDPPRQLGAMIAFSARFYARAADVLAIARSAGHAEPDLVELVRTGENRRRQAQAPLVRAWKRAGVLRPDLSPRQAADIFWSFTGENVYRLLIEECGWSVARYRTWLMTALARLLFS